MVKNFRDSSALTQAEALLGVGACVTALVPGPRSQSGSVPLYIQNSIYPIQILGYLGDLSFCATIKKPSLYTFEHTISLE